ncbi:o-succinylbenzoate synthase [Rhodococcus oxybenzonivorans]|uniref:o-succinylbenzoate synthase n=1 Tax=Rhodococcus oxybenzonivorans TaxID=1990687 RepID=UPI00295493F5|nr:o-succinylbenzoate synthase [Rhodococcus oxybenzonivorans]MDV7353148.1 o-succinylbenzoate synthase [Rhodococcus oxybenzonivorans]
MPSLPTLDEVLADAVAVSLPMRVRFRGITTREAMLVRGPAGWGEFAPFPEYADDEASHWLQSAIEAAWLGPPPALRDRVAVNATVPAVDAAQVPALLERYPGARTAKVKVAERGQTLADDVARVNAVRAHIPCVRVDANGGWSVDEAVTALHALTADGPLEYAEQPCASVSELVEVRRRVPAVRVAADESIRRADDPLKVVRAGGADVAVVKVSPLGGMRRLLALADELSEYGVPVVVSSALDTAVGIAAGVAAAAALPDLHFACGLGTGGLFESDVAEPREPVDGALGVASVTPDPARVADLAATPERARWWIERVRRCHGLLEQRDPQLFV